MEKHRYIDGNGLMLESPHGSKGDCILRTLFHHHSTKELNKSEVLHAITRCITTSHTVKNGIARHPDLAFKNNTSMDAMIAWILLNKLSRREKDFKHTVSQLPREISNKWKWTLPWWDWVKMQAGESRGYFFLLSTIFLGLAYWSNWPLKWLGFKKGSAYLGFYNMHLVSWMLWSTEKKSLLKWLARGAVAVAIPKNNALIRKLLGKHHNNELAYPAKGWKWERLPWVHYHGIDNSEISRDQAGFVIDVDILKNI